MPSPSSADLPICHETWTELPVTGQRHRWRAMPLCEERGPHFCATRALHAVTFFQAALVHTKGRWARKPFVLADWQREQIIEPLFGNVRWDPVSEQYVRAARSGWIEVARKNGKSEMLAGIALYMLMMDGEESAEVYGAARDRDQARIVWDTAERMCTLSPLISANAKRIGLQTLTSTRRIVVRETGSFYTTVARDALGNLGQNPHCIVFDEIIAQPDDRLWNSMRTAMGARTQPLLIAATTAGDDLSSFAANEHNECVRVADDPERAPHRFVYIRNLPMNADPWDESLWPQANPALGDYLSIDALREEAAEARNDPSKENAFRQFRLNQWVNQATRWMPMHLYDACVGEPWPQPAWREDFAGRECWIGLDLSARHDLTAMAMLFPPKTKGEPADVAFRFWAPEETLPGLDLATSGQASVWVRDGWLTLHDGAVMDYSRLVEDITETTADFRVREITYDKWSGEPVRQALEIAIGGGVLLVPNEPTFVGMTGPMTELMNLTVDQGWAHHANPVARWCFDSVEVKRATENPDLLKPVKPPRAAGGKRIDGVVAAALAVGAWRARGQVPARPRLVYGF